MAISIVRPSTYIVYAYSTHREENLESDLSNSCFVCGGVSLGICTIVHVHLRLRGLVGRFHKRRHYYQKINVGQQVEKDTDPIATREPQETRLTSPAIIQLENLITVSLILYGK